MTRLEIGVAREASLPPDWDEQKRPNAAWPEHKKPVTETTLPFVLYERLHNLPSNQHFKRSGEVSEIIAASFEDATERSRSSSILASRRKKIHLILLSCHLATDRSMSGLLGSLRRRGHVTVAYDMEMTLS